MDVIETSFLASELGVRVVVLGGLGNFGSRICRQLGRDPAFEIVATGRNIGNAIEVPFARKAMDLHAPNFPADLGSLRPDVVIHCAGPYQAQDYRVARAAMDCRAHYIDLADGRDFVLQFAARNESAAANAKRMAVTGASTLPALSSAVVDCLKERFAEIEVIEVVIAPGQHAPRGIATMAAVLSYAGHGFQWWRDGTWRTVYGWQELRRMSFPFGTRYAAACDVPDLELFPSRYAGVRTVSFRAALEVSAQHYALWCIAGLRRLGMPLRPDHWARRLNRTAHWFDRFGSDCGGMSVSVIGKDQSGRRRTATWYLVAQGNHGPEIPCMASILLTRKLARGEKPPIGAQVCMGMLTLSDFESEFARWDIKTSIKDELH